MQNENKPPHPWAGSCSRLCLSVAHEVRAAAGVTGWVLEGSGSVTRVCVGQDHVSLMCHGRALTGCPGPLLTWDMENLGWLSLGAASGSAWVLLLIVGGLLCFHLWLCCEWLLFLSQIRAGNSQLFWPLCHALEGKVPLLSPGCSLAQQVTRPEADLSFRSF